MSDTCTSTGSRSPFLTHSRASCENTGLSSTPMELMTHVLEYLPISCLRRASGVSRKFYASAWAAGLYIHRKIGCGLTSGHSKQLESFQDLVQHALSKNLHLSLSFLCHHTAETHSFDPGAEKEDKYHMRAVLAAITASLPLLVYLRVSLQSGPLDQNVMAALSYPAPRLRELLLSQGAYTLWPMPSFRTPLAHDLFAGYAPMLHSITLVDVAVGMVPVRAFSETTSLHLSYDQNFPDIVLCRHFPRLANLELTSASAEPLHLSRNFRLAGVSLQSLTIDEYLLYIRSTEDFDKIPVIRLKCRNISWIEPANDDAGFSLRLSNWHDELHAEFTITVVPTHRRWRRIYDVWQLFPAVTLPIADKPGALTHLTFLRMASTYLLPFLSRKTAFPALRGFTIDIRSELERATSIWPPDGETYSIMLTSRPDRKTRESFEKEGFYSVPCYALQELTLFALDEPVIVSSLEVAFLGRALGQVGRPRAEQAALVLVGVEFADQKARALLEQTHSPVILRTFTGLNTEDGQDGGLWQGEIQTND